MSICYFVSTFFCFEGMILVLIVSVPCHCLLLTDLQLLSLHHPLETASLHIALF